MAEPRPPAWLPDPSVPAVEIRRDYDPPPAYGLARVLICVSFTWVLLVLSYLIVRVTS